MMNTDEQRIDIIDNCDILLKKFSDYEQRDDTPEGRMIAQLNWLKERAEGFDLSLPVNQVYLSTLSYIYTDGTLYHHASTKDKVHEEMKIHMTRLLELTDEAHLLLKPPYYISVIRCIDALTQILNMASRPLDKYEKGFIKELSLLKNLLSEDKIEPPIGSHSSYPNLIESEDTVVDIPGAYELFKIIDNAIFNGVRPDSWLTLEDADKETVSL